MYKIFSQLLSWLQVPGRCAGADPLARMSLRDLADLPSQHRFERPARPQLPSPCGERCPG